MDNLWKKIAIVVAIVASVVVALVILFYIGVFVTAWL